MGNFLYRSAKVTPEPTPDNEKVVPKGQFSLSSENLANKNILIFGKRGKGKTSLTKNILSSLPFKFAHIVHDKENAPVSYETAHVKKTIYKGINENLIIDLMLDSKRYEGELVAFVADTRKRCKASKTYQGFMSKIIKKRLFTTIFTSDIVNKQSPETRSNLDYIIIFKESNAAYLHEFWETYLKHLEIPEETFKKRVLTSEDVSEAVVIDLKTKELLSLPSSRGPRTLV